MNEKYDLKRLLSDNPGLRAGMRSAHLRMGVKIALILAAAAALTAAMAIRYGAAVLPFGPAAGLILLLLLKPWRAFGRTRMGQIADVGYESRRVNRSKNFADNRYTSMETRNYIKCVCRDEAGKRFTFFVEQQYETVYRPGDRVAKLSGLPYPVTLTPDEQIVCPFCGQIIPARSADCTGCGRDAVKIWGKENIP